MIVCGLDASTSCTGWSIFENGVLIAHGAIKPKGDDWRDRVMELTMDIAQIFKRYRPAILYIEDVPMKKGLSNNRKTWRCTRGYLGSMCSL